MEDESGVLMGIDLGTSSVKVVILDAHGTVVASNSKSTDAEVPSDVGNIGHEQNPYKILETVLDLALPMLNQHKCHIKGIGITGQMHGVVMWGPAMEDDRDYQLKEYGINLHCSNLYTWEDQRCCKNFLGSLPKPSNLCQPLASGHGCATLYWLARHRPKLISSSEFSNCGSIMDLLVFYLCDAQQAVTSEQLAHSFGYYCEDSRTWDTVL